MLFPVAPSLSALTFTGALNPILSPDRTKIAYAIPTQNGTEKDKTGLWVIELGNLPIGFSRDPRQITDAEVNESSWQWSPDSRKLLLTTPQGTFLVNAGALTPQKKLVNIQGAALEKLLLGWEEKINKKLKSQLKHLPEAMQDILERKAENIVFSPDENKVLYVASGGAKIPNNLIQELPGSSTQEQERNIKEKLF